MSLLEACGSLYKWSIASLVLVNGGALVALLQNERLPLSIIDAGAPFFVAGIMLALFAGFLGAFAMLFLALLWKGIGMREGHGGLFSPDKRTPEMKAADRRDPVKRMALVSVFLALGSILSFVAGSAMIGSKLHGLTSTEQVPAKSSPRKAALPKPSPKPPKLSAPAPK